MKLYEPAPPARKDELANVQDGIAIIVDGDTCPVAVESGSYAYIKNNTHGLAEGLYKNKSNSAFPVSGGTADSTVFEADSTGGLNELNASLSDIVCKSIKGTWNGATYDISNSDLGVTDCTEYVWAISLVGSTDGSQYSNLVWLSTVNTNKLRIRAWVLNNANNGTITVLQGSHGSEIFQVLGIKKR